MLFLCNPFPSILVISALDDILPLSHDLEVFGELTLRHSHAVAAERQSRGERTSSSSAFSSDDIDYDLDSL